MEFDELEGPAFDAYLKLIDAVKQEGARLNNMTMEAAWGKNGALQLVQLLPEHLGVATLTSTTHYGYRFSVAVGAADGLINHLIPAQRVAGIYGYNDSTPGVRLSSQLNLSIGSRLARQWPMKPTQSQINDQSNRLDPILVPASKTIVITNACYTAGNLELTFLGVYAEPKP